MTARTPQSPHSSLQMNLVQADGEVRRAQPKTRRILESLARWASVVLLSALAGAIVGARMASTVAWPSIIHNPPNDAAATVATDEDIPTPRPIIGVLTLPCRDFGATYTNCPGDQVAWFPASYVKWVEAAGARTVPLFHTWSADQLRSAMGSVNGVLLPGGNATYDAEYQVAVKEVINHAMDLFSRGGFLPVWGTCLGMESLATTVSQRGLDALTHGLGTLNVMLPLAFSETRSRLFAHAPSVHHKMATERLAFNQHTMGMLLEDWLSDAALSSTFDVVATSHDPVTGQDFVAVVEGKGGLPIYGVQFHPEKSAFEWSPLMMGQKLHTDEAVESTNYLSRFFVSEARRCDHRFSSPEAESKALIYNFAPSYSAGYFAQCYYFEAGAVAAVLA